MEGEEEFLHLSVVATLINVCTLVFTEGTWSEKRVWMPIYEFIQLAEVNTAVACLQVSWVSWWVKSKGKNVGDKHGLSQASWWGLLPAGRAVLCHHRQLCWIWQQCAGDITLRTGRRLGRVTGAACSAQALGERVSFVCCLIDSAFYFII